jgi:hypothetical protein
VIVPHRLRLVILRVSGILLVVLGILHLAVTPHIAHLLQRAVMPNAVDWLTAPMLLNHVVVGILLLPLGVLTAYAAPDAARGVRWALIVCRIAAVTIASLPPTLFVLMGTRYFGAFPFQIATGIVCAASALLLCAAFWPMARPSDVTDV